MYHFMLTTYDGSAYKTNAGDFIPALSGDTEWTAYCKIYEKVTGFSCKDANGPAIFYWRLWKDEPLLMITP